jgi:ubiquinone biosynthesis protein UbiJ
MAGDEQAGAVRRLTSLLGNNRLVTTIINRYLSLDPAAGDRLARLDGRVIALELRGFDTRLVFRVQGRKIAFPDDTGLKPDTLLRGTPIGIARLALGGGNSTGSLFSGEVEIEGDVETGQAFKTILDDIDIDWEEQLAGYTGDVLAHQLGNAARHMSRWLQHTRLTLEMDLSEYLQEELRLVPTRIEIENLLEDITRLGMDADRLEARLQRLLSAGGDK